MPEIELIYSEIFRKFPELVFGFSTKPGGVSPGELKLNLSFSVGDNPEFVKANRKLFFNKLKIKEEEVTFQKQIHSSQIHFSNKPCFIDGCDAIYTNRENNFLAVSTADCIPVFLYSPGSKVVAGIHAGWKGTKEKIVFKTIEELKKNYSVDLSSMIAFIGPGICKEHYEVGKEVADLFDDHVKSAASGKKYILDLKLENFNQLVKSGLKKENIEVCGLCTYGEKILFHSFRRDGEKAGRMLGIIGIRK